MDKIALYWMRRDMRLHDNAALYHALKSGYKVLPIFIFDQNILNKLEDDSDPRVTFIHHVVAELKKELQSLHADLEVNFGDPLKCIERIISKRNISAIYTNRDYESYAVERDNQVKTLCDENNISFNSYKDHVIFEAEEVTKDDGDPYVVFTPFKRKWFEKLNSDGKGMESYFLKSYPTEKYFNNFLKESTAPLIPLEEIGFKESSIQIPSKSVAQGIISNYDKNRNFPGIEGTSRLGIHYRFGTISIREKARKALSLNETYLSELIWRDFYSSILQAYPHVENNAFRPKYDRIQWRNNEEEFKAWCEGRTGYPMVDAGMRQLNTTGFMHNRVRMVVASFLTKHLLIDWRWGEAYFAEKLLDFDLASNNGGWQWAAGSGTDAAPYFRIFNPESQWKKFDPKSTYIKTYIEEFNTSDYPEPIVVHKEARERCLATYKNALTD